MRNVSELPVALAAVLDTLRDPLESIWDWHRASDGTISVALLREDDIPQAERMIAIGLAGGMGRSLHFLEKSGTWSLVGQGR